MAKVKVDLSQKPLKPSPTVYLTEKEGNYVKGILKRKSPHPSFKENKSYLIEVFDTNASTRLYNKETKSEEEVKLQKGDHAFLTGFTILNTGMDQVPEGEYIEIVFRGKGKKKKGQRPPFLVDLSYGQED